MPSRRPFPLIAILFAGSGCSALIYEVAWYQYLQLAIGSTSVSLGILLATFMGGLCIGSIFFPKLNLTGKHPLRVYSAIELGIGILGVAVTAAMPFISYVYVAGASSGMPGMLLRGVVAAVAMLPSTILMGASLPSVARYVESTAKGVARWAWLYGFNTAGAVAGCLLAGFYLLRLYDMKTAAWTAAGINIVVAAVSWLLGSGQHEATPQEDEPAGSGGSSGLSTVYLVTAISGACAMGAEVIWTRLLSMLMLGTVYVFSIILAVFLIGLAVGGAAAARITRRTLARTALGWSQFLIVLGMLWTAWMIATKIPFWVDAATTTNDPWTMSLLDLKRAVWAVLPASLCWGAAFPLACAAAVSSERDDAALVTGRVYAANTLGAIIGALSVSLVLVPAIGTQQSARVLMLLAAIGGLVALWPRAKMPAGVAAVASLMLAIAVPATPGELIAYGRRMGENAGQSKVLKVVEGINSSVAITKWGEATYVNVNGHVEATTERFDMKLQRMVGHLPTLLHPNPKSVLGIGFGAGVTAGTFTRYPGIEHITICEIEPVIPPTSTEFFAEADYAVFRNPKTHVVFDDARHYLLTTNDKFDVIASDPLDVFVKGTAALYSREYFESVKHHLNPGGYFSLYVPLYETDTPTIRSEIETFFAAFPNATLWANTRDGQGYDMVFMGQAEPLKINVDEIAARLDRPDYGPVKESLADVGIYSAEGLFSTYSGQKRDVGRWTEGADINSDSNLRLSYLAGWGINAKLDDQHYRQMLHFRQEPDNLFTGAEDRLKSLYRAIQSAQ